MKLVDANGTRWHSGLVSAPEETYCCSCGLYIYSSTALFNAELVKEADRVLHNDCFEIHDQTLRLLRDENDRRDNQDVEARKE